jgi:hypothetical protein
MDCGLIWTGRELLQRSSGIASTAGKNGKRTITILGGF